MWVSVKRAIGEKEENRKKSKSKQSQFWAQVKNYE